MASGEWAVVAASAVGFLGMMGTTWLTHHLKGRKRARIDNPRKCLLKKALVGAEKKGWMSIETLAHTVGADLETTRALLIQIDARGSMKTDKEMWSLISRNPLPTSSDAE